MRSNFSTDNVAYCVPRELSTLILVVYLLLYKQLPGSQATYEHVYD